MPSCGIRRFPNTSGLHGKIRPRAGEDAGADGLPFFRGKAIMVKTVSQMRRCR